MPDERLSAEDLYEMKRYAPLTEASWAELETTRAILADLVEANDAVGFMEDDVLFTAADQIRYAKSLARARALVGSVPQPPTRRVVDDSDEKMIGYRVIDAEGKTLCAHRHAPIGVAVHGAPAVPLLGDPEETKGLTDAEDSNAVRPR